MAQWGIVFAVNEEYLSSRPQHPSQELVAGACHQHGDTETAGSLDSSPPSRLSKNGKVIVQRGALSPRDKAESNRGRQQASSSTCVCVVMHV